MPSFPIVTAQTCTSSTTLASILSVYPPRPGFPILDMTWGKGAFWNGVTVPFHSKLVTMDSQARAGIKADFTQLPFRKESFSMAVLDPPYGNSGGSHASSFGIEESYRLKAGNSHLLLMEMYEFGLREAWQVLIKGGVLVVKCQDAIESGKQKWTLVELFSLAKGWGFSVLDLFIQVQERPPRMRHTYQLHARKNHSYFIVMKKES